MIDYALHARILRMVTDNPVEVVEYAPTLFDVERKVIATDADLVWC